MRNMRAAGRCASRRSMSGSRPRAPASAPSSAGSGRTGSPRRAWPAKDIYSYGRQNWFDAVGAEHRAARERVAVFDQTSFAKFLLVGRDAEAALSWIAANDVSRPAGSLVYTQMLNRRGGIECDLTVSRLAEDSYYIVTGTGFATHDFAWIQANIPSGLEARLIDVTSAYGVLSLMGPRSREVLAAVAEADLSNAGFPFGSWREIMIAGAPVRALRVTYVGELGWELHVPVEAMAAVYQGLMEAGRAAWHRQCRLSRHRIPAAGEGLSRLGLGYRPRPYAAGGRPRLGGEAEAEHALPRPRGAGGPGGKAAGQAPRLLHRSPIPPSSCWGARRSFATASRSAG